MVDIIPQEKFIIALFVEEVWKESRCNMDEFIDKLIEEEKIKVTSLEIIVTGTKEKPYFEIKYREVGKEDYDIGYSSYDLNNVFTWKDECFEIVNELAEEYKGGWIPCGERLPKDRKEKLVYLSSNRITIARYNDHRLPYSDYPIGWGFPAPYFYIDFEKETVIAWMPLPAPFKEGE